jgi:AcrR family transcriptional regulator
MGDTAAADGPKVDGGLTGTKARIVDTALELFARRGYDAVSVRDIARAVGIKDSSIYSHFVSKDEILDTIFGLMRREFIAGLPAEADLERILEKCPPLAFLERGFELFRQRVSDPRQARIYLVLMREQYNDSRSAGLWHQHQEQVLAYIEAAFRLMVAKGLLNDLDPRQMAFSYEYAHLLLLAEYVRLLCQGQDTAGVEARIRSHREFFLEMAGAKK